MPQISLSFVFWVVAAVFAVYRLSTMIALDTIADPLRNLSTRLVVLSGKSEDILSRTIHKAFRWIAELIHCSYCTGVWFSLVPAVLLCDGSVLSFFYLWLGIAGVNAFILDAVKINGVRNGGD